tara:strand:+ start:96 stop:326 length:231 start_codon:yes stop_codon:yes gene_type:complete
MNNKLLELTSEFFKVDVNLLNENTTADDVEGWDSLAHATFIIFLEKEFGVEFDLQEMLEIDTLGSLSRLIENSLKK